MSGLLERCSTMLSKKVSKVIPLDNLRLLVFFENGVIKIFDVSALIKDYPEFEILREPAIFQSVHVEAGGYGISWNEELDCSEGELWDNGIEIPLSLSDFISFIKYDVVNTTEAAELMHCTRQNVDSYVKRGKLKPVKTFQRTKLFLRNSLQTF